MKYKSSVQITNSTKESKMLILEPWAEEFEMLSGDTFEFVGEGEKEGKFEIEFSENAIIVFGWESSTVKIFCDGNEINNGASGKLAVPTFLEGKNFLSFVKFMFYENK
jgi:hypothetical protein